MWEKISLVESKHNQQLKKSVPYRSENFFDYRRLGECLIAKQQHRLLLYKIIIINMREDFIDRK